MKQNKIHLKTKKWYKKREQLFLFRKLTDISKPNTIFVKDVDAPTDCIGSRNTSGWGTDTNTNNNIPLLCYIVKHFFYIPPILVVWQCATIQTGVFATDVYMLNPIREIAHFMNWPYYSCPFRELGNSLLIFCPVNELGKNMKKPAA
jgi:hypothetical protein